MRVKNLVSSYLDSDSEKEGGLEGSIPGGLVESGEAALGRSPMRGERTQSPDGQRMSSLYSNKS